MTSARLCGAIVALGLSTAFATQAVAPQPATIPDSVAHLYKSIDGIDLRLHVFPASAQDSSSQRAAIVFFFGGAWTNGSVMQFVPQSKHLSERGMVAIVVDYRVFSRHATSAFEAIADAKSAIRWVRSHAKELGVDPRRIAA